MKQTIIKAEVRALLKTLKEYEAKKKPQEKRSASEPAQKREEKKSKTEPRPVSVVSVKDEVARIEDNIRPRAKAKSSARSTSDVEIGNITLNNRTDRDYWDAQRTNEIRAQLVLRGTSKRDWIHKET